MTRKPLHEPAPAAPAFSHRRRQLRARGPALLIPEHPAEVPGGDTPFERPDGWYWQAPDGRQEFGPFGSAERARADRDRAGEESVDEAETEREAEIDLGVREAVREGENSLVDGDLSDDPPGPAR